MSHQTGIKANDKLMKVFSKCQNGKIRVIKISIENDELTCSGTAEPKKDWERDYDKLVQPMLEENVPCYILYRLDNKTNLGYAWLLLSWVPDTATIRQKMLHASTKATLKTEFGSANITEEFHATTVDESTLEGYQRMKKDLCTPAPMTMREEELAEMRKTELNTEIHTETKNQTLGGIDVKTADDVESAVRNFLHGKCNYVQFGIDMKTEEVHVTHAEMIELTQLPELVPSDQGRYHLYLFKHTHESDYHESVIFIYSMPGYKCKVRERMLYSSCKGTFVMKLEAQGVKMAKKLEIDYGSELTEEYLLDQLHPQTMLHQPAFAKPKGPPNRGAKRLTRPQDGEE